MSLRILQEHKVLAVNTAIISVLGIALLLSTIALSLPYYNSLARAQTKNNTAGATNCGIGNINTIPKIANLGPGNNTKIILKNKNIGNPNAFKAFGKEHAVTAKTPASIRQLPNMTSGCNNNIATSSAQKSNTSSSGNSSQTK
ncbi:MAG: hypothetical protein JO327_12290 [Nitrososphaeraceae archaeon]|nr:hypothetical protein [Nitrososphaeraceae archaeon]MBV9668894.1 hypothetical protein [Nitrososphaeraceae archaeon]